MIIVHHLENSQSIRILWLLEELGVDYKIQHYSRRLDNSLAPAEFKKLHPMGTSPLISDGDLKLPESNAIIDYLLTKYGNGRLVPTPGTPEHTRYLFWFHAAQGSFQPMLMFKLMVGRIAVNSPLLLRPILGPVAKKMTQMALTPRIKSILTLIERDLANSPWFAGDEMTAADIVMGYCMEVAEVRVAMSPEEYPNAHKFLKRMRSRPQYKTALKKNGPFKPLAQ